MKPFFYLSIIFLLSACYNPAKQLEKGNYSNAYSASLQSLKKKKDRNVQKVLIESLQAILDEKNSTKNELLETDDIKDVEKAIKINQSLQEKVTDAQAYTDGSFDEDLSYLMIEEDELKEFIADTYFDFGVESLDEAILKEDKAVAEDAYHYFEKAIKYGKQNDSIDSLSTFSYEYAQRVYVIDVNTSFLFSYSFEVENACDDLEREAGHFEQIYVDDHPDEGVLVDCEIELNFRDLDIDAQTRNSTQDFKKTIVTGSQTIELPDGTTKVEDITEEVTGSVSTREIIKVATWDVRMNVSKLTQNCRMYDRTFSRELISESIEHQLSGDRQAIPDSYKNARFDRIMEDDDMVDELLEDIIDEISSHF